MCDTSPPAPPGAVLVVPAGPPGPRYSSGEISVLTRRGASSPAVAAWWAKTVDAIYQKIPDFAGFVVKADSEGKPGPSQYGRSPAQAANVLARALKPHGGLVLYRGFVYNHHLDWKDLKADRARAGYDNFHALDGKFEPNVVIQVKHGPIDFQVREPVSPLFAALERADAPSLPPAVGPAALLIGP